MLRYLTYGPLSKFLSKAFSTHHNEHLYYSITKTQMRSQVCNDGLPTLKLTFYLLTKTICIALRNAKQNNCDNITDVTANLHISKPLQPAAR